jgi:hypothetical protein
LEFCLNKIPNLSCFSRLSLGTAPWAADRAQIVGFAASEVDQEIEESKNRSDDSNAAKDKK